MTGEHLLHLPGGQAVAGHVDHVVDAAHDVQVAVAVAVAAVAGGVKAAVLRQVGAHEPVVVAPQGGQATRWQRQPDHDLPGLAGLRLGPLGVENADVVAGHRHRGRAGLGRHGIQAHRVSRNGPAGLGLPPVVHDRDAEQLARPPVGLGVEPLAGQEQVPEPGQVVPHGQRPIRILLLDGADRGRRGEQGLDPVLGDDPPERAGIGRADRLALVQHARAPGQQRGVDDVGVAYHPAHVGGRPEHLAGPGVVDVGHAPAQRDRVPAVIADHALRPGRGARGVQDVQRIGRRQRDAVRWLGPGQRLVPVQVAARGQRGHGGGPLPDHAVVRLVPGQVDGAVQDGLVGHDAADLDPGRCRHHHLRRGIVDARRQLVRREPAEHHRVHRADPCAGQHGDHRLGDHRHVDDHPVAPADAQPAQRAGEPRDLVQQLGVGVGPRGAGNRAVVDQRGLAAPAVADVPVQRVEAGVQHPVGKPPVERRIRVVKHRRGCPVPVDRPRRLTPETLGIGQAAAEHFAVSAHAELHLHIGACSKRKGAVPFRRTLAPKVPTMAAERPYAAGQSSAATSTCRRWPRSEIISITMILSPSRVNPRAPISRPGTRTTRPGAPSTSAARANRVPRLYLSA